MEQEAREDDVIMSEHDEQPDGFEAPQEAEAGPDLDGPAEALAAERDELKDLLLRKQAEFENFRKRTERERGEFVRFALADCVSELLNVLDSFELALRDIASEGPEAVAVHRGYELIYKQLAESLERFGLEAIDAQGAQFDPHLHEGVSTQPSSDVPEGTVLEELRKGYLLKGKLLRPTMVLVAGPPEAQGDEEASS